MAEEVALIVSDDGPGSYGLSAMDSAVRRQAIPTRTVSSDSPVTNQGTALRGIGGMTAAGAVRKALAGEQGLRAVIVGVNEGPNTGRELVHSGTFGAALCASLWALPSAAVSLDDVISVEGAQSDCLHWSTASAIGGAVVRIAERCQTVQVVPNINVPNLPLGDISGVHLTCPQGFPNYNELPTDRDVLAANGVSVSLVGLWASPRWQSHWPYSMRAIEAEIIELAEGCFR